MGLKLESRDAESRFFVGSIDDALSHRHENILERRILIVEAPNFNTFFNHLLEQSGESGIVDIQLGEQLIPLDLHFPEPHFRSEELRRLSLPQR